MLIRGTAMDNRAIQNKLKKEAELAIQATAISAAVYFSVYISLLDKIATHIAPDLSSPQLEPLSALNPEDKPNADASFLPITGPLERSGHGDLNWEALGDFGVYGGRGAQNTRNTLRDLAESAELELQSIINVGEENEAAARASQFRADLAASEDERKKHGPK